VLEAHLPTLGGWRYRDEEIHLWTFLVTSLPDGTLGVAYHAALRASGGTGTYTWSLARGAFPPGLTLKSAGTISGIPTTAGTFAFTVSVSDPVTLSLSITILAAPAVATTSATPAPALVSNTPPPATASTTLAATGSEVSNLVTAPGQQRQNMSSRHPGTKGGMVRTQLNGLITAGDTTFGR
jgi:large repetitive protein